MFISNIFSSSLSGVPENWLDEARRSDYYKHSTFNNFFLTNFGASGLEYKITVHEMERLL